MNNPVKKLYSEVPEFYRRDGVRWIVLDYDSDDTGGYFLYLHESLDEEAIYDEWYENRLQAELSAEDSWGIASEKWKAL